MTAPSTVADIDTDVAYLARMMLDKRIRSIPVLDRGKLIGIVTARDFLRVLARPDQLLVRDVQERLAAFSSPDRWTVEVRDGEATIVDRFDSERDREVATVLAEGVPGVIRARCVVRGAESQRNV
jgi:CBS domain-containing protein